MLNPTPSSSGTDTLEDVGRTKQLMEEQQITMSERKKAVDQQNASHPELTLALRFLRCVCLCFVRTAPGEP